MAFSLPSRKAGKPFVLPSGQTREKEVVKRVVQEETPGYFDPVPDQIRVRDFVRELPGAAGTVAKAVGGFAKGVFQGVAGSGASAALGVQRLFTGEDVFTPTTQIEKAILGEEPIKSVPLRVAETELKLQELGLGKPGDITAPATPLAAIGVIGLTALDFTGFGGSRKGVIKLIAESKNEGEIANILRKINVHEDIIPTAAEKLATVAKEKEVSQALDSIDRLQKNTKITVAENGYVPAVQPALRNVSHELNTEFLKQDIKSTVGKTGGDLIKMRPIGNIPADYREQLGEKVYSSDGYLQKKYELHQDEIDIETFSRLPEVISNPSYVKVDPRQGKEGTIIFVKNLNDNLVAVVQARSSIGRLTIFKTEFQPKEKIQKFLDFPDLPPGGRAPLHMPPSQARPSAALSDLRGESFSTLSDKVPPVKITRQTVKPEEYTAARRVVSENRQEARQYIEPKIEAEQFEKSIFDRNIVQGIKNSSYYRKERGVKDIMGEGTLMQKGDKYIIAEPGERSKYLNRGYATKIEIDTLAQDAGFEHGYDFLEKQLRLADLPRSENVARRVEQALSGNEQYQKAKKLIDEMRQTKVSMGRLLTQQAKEGQMLLRRKRVKAVRDYLGISDADMKKISQKDIRLMNDNEFQTFLTGLEKKAVEFADRRQAANEVLTTIRTKELKKIENLQQAMKLPAIERMTTEQLRSLDDTLQRFKIGDEFLSVRKLETVDRTDLKGIKTVREAKERLAQELKVSPDELNNIKVNELDRFRYDTALAERNPFYGLMVDETNKALLNAEARFIIAERKVNDLLRAARASRTRSLVERLVPQDKKIFQWLEAKDKSAIAKQMTTEELRAAQYIQNQYREMRDYLVSLGMLKKYRSDYITHIRRGFLEEWKETNLLNAFKSVFKQHQVDEAVFNILDNATGQVLPLEKFFQFSLKRTGGISPTENVAKAFLAYKKAFEKKAALDSIVPKLDIYVHSLTPKLQTERGLVFDRSLKTFFNEWMNSKKGRQTSLLGIKQGGKLDTLLRAGKTFTTLLDLGINIPVGISARGGENVTTFVMLGTRDYARGLLRARTIQGKAIVDRYENFVGRSPWDELFDAKNTISDTLINGSMALFRDASMRANKTFLLGSLSDAEWKSGIISPDRLAFLKREMGRYRVTEGAGSVIGATSPGKVFTQYKTWAVPIVRTMHSNVVALYKMLRAGKNPTRSREFQEILRVTLATLSIVYVVRGIAGIDEKKKNKTFTDEVLSKAYRDSMSIIGALTPSTMLQTPRMMSFLNDLGKNLGDIKNLEKQLTPRVIKQFIPKTETKKSSSLLPQLPKLPKLPSLPKIGQ